MKTFSVSQTFEIFGFDCLEEFSSIELAEKHADELAAGIADSFWTKKGGRAVSTAIEETSGGTGMSKEVDFSNNLPWVNEDKDEGAEWEEYDTITMPWDELVSMIRESAIEIEEIV